MQNILKDFEFIKRKHYPFDFSDARLVSACFSCGEPVEDKDHVPAKVYLKRPFPNNLDYVGACKLCNGGASKDEEYTACVIEAVVCGSLELSKLRPEIRSTLRYQKRLYARLNSDVVSSQPFSMNIDRARVAKALVKLAKGHAVHELNFNGFDHNLDFRFSLLNELSDSRLEEFMTIPPQEYFSEIGTRAMQRTIESDYVNRWIEVQENQYYFTAFESDSCTVVRIIMSNYLLVEAVWSP